MESGFQCFIIDHRSFASVAFFCVGGYCDDYSAWNSNPLHDMLVDSLSVVMDHIWKTVQGTIEFISEE